MPSTERIAKKPEVLGRSIASKLPMRKNRCLRQLVLWFGIPSLFYLLFFTMYASTWVLHFNTRFFTDQGDGFQNVWNMWWVNFSVTHLHQLPWHTTYLHYPYGVSLIGQTLNPFNGFVGIVLTHIFRMSLVQAFNIMVVFSFVFAGMSAFWLCYHLSRKYIPSLIGGFIFTFSSYHFAHAIGHMQLVSLEWIPLFILLWWKLLTTPRYRYAIGAAITLLLVLFCDYYYLIYSVIIAGIIFLYLWRKKELANWKKKSTYGPWLLFVGLSLVMVAPLPVALLRENARDPLQGGHDDRTFSADLVNIVLDGEFWRFGWLTHFYWGAVKAYWAESSIYLTFSVLVTLVIALWKRTKINTHINLWIVIGVIFGIMSLGPRLMVHGYSINHAPLPYALFERIFPTLKLSGDPVRWIMITILASAVIASMVLARLDLSKRRGQILLAVFFVVLCVELWPQVLPLNIASAYPKYVTALAKLPHGAVLDNGAVSGTWQLYDQVIDGQPEPLGYISRVPTSVANKDEEFVQLVNPAGYAKLCSVYKIRYITIPATRPLQTTFPIIYNDHQTLIYDLKDSPNC